MREEKCSFLGGLFRLATVAVAVYGAVTATKRVLARLSRRMEEDNEGSKRKRYLVGLASREICLEDEETDGVDLAVIGGSVGMDLCDTILSEETFVKVRVLAGNVVVKVPAMVRVILDGKGVVCGFSNQVPSYEDESLPIIYVNAECLGACVKIVLEEE